MSIEDRNVDELDGDEANLDNEASHNDREKGKKGPTYAWSQKEVYMTNIYHF